MRILIIGIIITLDVIMIGYLIAEVISGMRYLKRVYFIKKKMRGKKW